MAARLVSLVDMVANPDLRRTIPGRLLQRTNFAPGDQESAQTPTKRCWMHVAIDVVELVATLVRIRVCGDPSAPVYHRDGVAVDIHAFPVAEKVVQGHLGLAANGCF